MKEREVREVKEAETEAGNRRTLQLMAPVYGHFLWILWPPAVSLALCGIPALQQAGTLWYRDTGKQLMSRQQLLKVCRTQTATVWLLYIFILRWESAFQLTHNLTDLGCVSQDNALGYIKGIV